MQLPEDAPDHPVSAIDDHVVVLLYIVLMVKFGLLDRNDIEPIIMDIFSY